MAIIFLGGGMEIIFLGRVDGDYFSGGGWQLFFSGWGDGDDD